jgi:hypothetical protein
MNNAAAIIHSVWFENFRLPFAWGSADCLTFCADVAKALTGRDVLEELRGKYHTERGAQLAGARLGYKVLADVPARFFPEIAPADAMNGDWALVINSDGTPTLGIVLGACILSRTPEGLGRVERTEAVKAWKVVD